MSKDVLKAKLAKLPTRSGVYLFKDAEGRHLYIGKAKDLRNRIRSYFQQTRILDSKMQVLKRLIDDVEYILTDTEVEALILESTLVKKHKPRFNVHLKDDKSFLHIKLTVNEPFPRVRLTRRVRDDGARYFGPYLPASLARNTLKIINRHFQLRTCDLEIDGKLDRPCLEYHIKRCLGPCVRGLCSPEEYGRAVLEVISLLEGKNEDLLRVLRRKMEEAASRQNFEGAAFFRDRMRMVRELGEKQKMILKGGDDVDLFAYYREGPRLALQLFTLRDGRVVGKREFYWEDLDFFDPRQFLRGALQQYYLAAGFIPREIYLPVQIEDQEIISRWLSTRKGRKVRMLAPARGRKHDLLLLVERNARISFETRFRVLPEGRRRLLEAVRKELDLPSTPGRIEAFDVSNIQGAETVASLVVCLEGRLSPSEYRKFRIQGVEGADDFSSIREAVRRRYLRLLEENRQLPDLILVDGGKGQLHAAYQALSELGVETIPLAGLAKREEHLFVKGQMEPVVLDRNSSILHLFQQIRDEAHRFAVTYHRRRRTIRDFSSQLDEIPGVGEKRRKRLLRNFGSVERIRRAAPEELVPFVGKKLAREILARLNVAADTES